MSDDPKTFLTSGRFDYPLNDQIDQALASYYGFTDEELDFILNYDIKYRMGNSWRSWNMNVWY